MAISGVGQTKTFAQLQTEFGGSHPITMGEYAAYRVSGSGNTIDMDDFAGASAVIPTVSNVQNYTGTYAADFDASLSYSGAGVGSDTITYQLVVRTTTSGSNYVATLYVEETSDSSGTYNGSAMTTGTLYPIQTVTFTQANWPGSYALDHSVAIAGSSGTVQTTTSLLAGVGETYSFGTNWDNTALTLLTPTTSTAGKVQHLTGGECYTGTVTYTDTFIWKFIKSGYPDLTTTFTVLSEQDLSFSGICP